MFSPLWLITIIVQVGLIVHVIRTGRNGLWMLAIGLLPGVGSLAYIVVELIPDLLRGRTAKRAGRGVRRMLDPDRNLRQASTAVEISGNVDARRRLAEELFERGQYGDAITTYQAGLKGIFEHDPPLLLGLAKAQFAQHDHAGTRATLERLRRENPDFNSVDAGLLYARTLEAQDLLTEAEREYGQIAGSYPGAEARLRHGLLLKRLGRTEEAHRVFKDLLDGAKIGPPHFRKAQAEWLDLARRELG